MRYDPIKNAKLEHDEKHSPRQLDTWRLVRAFVPIKTCFQVADGKTTCIGLHKSFSNVGKSWFHPRESGPEVVQGPGGVVSPTLLGPVLVWHQQNWDCCWPCGISSPPRAAVPATLLRGKASPRHSWDTPERKSGCENEWMNEWM